jgi:hypothetical protein
MRAFTIALLAGLAAAPAALAQQPRELSGYQVIRLFVASCVATLAQRDEVEAHVRSHGYEQLPEAVAQDFLAGERGRAWLANEHASIVLALHDAGLCQLFVPTTPGDAVRTELDKMLKAVADRGGDMGAVIGPDQVTEEDGRKYKTSMRFLVLKSGRKLLLLLKTAENPDDGLQAILSAALGN